VIVEVDKVITEASVVNESIGSFVDCIFGKSVVFLMQTFSLIINF
jgi:hypothetical protein